MELINIAISKPLFMPLSLTRSLFIADIPAGLSFPHMEKSPTLLATTGSRDGIIQLFCPRSANFAADCGPFQATATCVLFTVIVADSVSDVTEQCPYRGRLIESNFESLWIQLTLSFASGRRPIFRGLLVSRPMDRKTLQCTRRY